MTLLAVVATAATVLAGGTVALAAGATPVALTAGATPHALARAASSAPPVVTGVSPDAGALAGGTTVTITGTGFRSPAAVSFGGVAGTHAKVISADRLTVTAPPQAAGTVDVRVAGTYGTSPVSTKDHYTYTPGPVVTGITPSSGPLKGGSTVTVTGTGFNQVTGVSFDTAKGKGITVLTSVRLTVIVPAGSAGTVNVQVKGAYGTSSVTPQDQYTYQAPTPPSAVTGVAVTGTTSSSITLSWTDPSGDGYAGVVIRRAKGAVPPDKPTSGTAVADVAAPATTWTDTGLSAGTTYSYALFAHDAASDYAGAAVVSGTTAPKSGCTPAVQHVSGTLTSDTTWSPSCTTAYVIDGYLDVPAGITLTVAPGAVVKASGQLSVEGTLDVAGTAAAPAVFTSVNDSTVGGVTGTGPPATGDWSGIWVNNGSADIEHAKISYATSALGGGTEAGSVVVQDTQITSVQTGLTDDQPFGIYSSGIFGVFTATGDTITASADGIDVMSPAATVTGNVITSGAGSSSPAGLVIEAAGAASVTPAVVADNTVTAPAGRSPYAVDSPALDFAQLATNSMGSSAQPGFVVAGTVASSQTWPAEPYPWLLTEIAENGVGADGVDVESGATLTVSAGTVLKASGPDNPNDSGTIVVEGTLDVAGTASAPVVLTSVNDATVGGVTGTAAPAAGDWSGIWLDNGNADIEHAKISYASSAVAGSSAAGSVVVRDTQIASVQTGLTDDQPFAIYSSGVFAVFTADGDSVAASAAGIDVTSADATVTGNVVESGTGSWQGGIVVVGAGATLNVTPPDVVDNTVTATAGRAAYKISSPALDFAQLATNSTGSSAQPGFVLAGTVASSQTMPSEPYPWLVTGITQSGGLSAVGLDVPSGVTLTVAPGTVVKAYGPIANWITKITVEGTLDAAGTAGSPVTFTSANDDSVGGTTSWDGSDSAPAPNDWDGISVDGGSIELDSTTVAYAATAVNFDGTSGLLSSVTLSNSAQAVLATAGTLSLRGTLSGNASGVHACDWGNGCVVDAAYVNWGTPAGPFPSGQSPLACGAVTVTPWIDAGSDVTSNLWAAQNCDGSAAPSAQLAAAQSGFNETIAGQQVDCSDGLQAACQEAQTMLACYANLDQIAWSNVSIAGVPATPPSNGDVTGVLNSWLETADIPVVSSLASAHEFGGYVLAAVSLYSQLIGAYNTCTS